VKKRRHIFHDYVENITIIAMLVSICRLTPTSE
jgi:hypothetical protein